MKCLNSFLCFVVLLAIVPMLGAARVFAGTMTLTTYYPAPNGNYHHVTLVPGNDTAGGACATGATASNSNGALMYCVDNNIDKNPGSGGLPIGGTLAGSGTWGNMIAKTPVSGTDPDTAVATKAYVDAASGPPGSWTCTVRTTVFGSGQPALCQGTEKVINGGCSYCFNSITGAPYAYSGMPTSVPPSGQEGWDCCPYCNGTGVEDCFYSSALCCK